MSLAFEYETLAIPPKGLAFSINEEFIMESVEPCVYQITEPLLKL